jgi:hypothetical protein
MVVDGTAAFKRRACLKQRHFFLAKNVAGKTVSQILQPLQKPAKRRGWRSLSRCSRLRSAAQQSLKNVFQRRRLSG